MKDQITYTRGSGWDDPPDYITPILIILLIIAFTVLLWSNIAS